MYMYAYNHNSEIFVHDRAGFTFSALLNSREGSRFQKNRHYCFIINTTTEKKMTGTVRMVTEDSQFQPELANAGTKLVVVDYYATW